MADEFEPLPPSGQILIYQDGGLNLQVRLDGQTVWLTQAAMAELFQTTPQNITIHLKSIYDEGELREEATCKEHLQVRQEGARKVERLLKHYNLDAILAVGYRVRSARGTSFRQWATAQLRSLLVKGFVLDDERIKAGRTLGEGYFDELLQRIRDIRASAEDQARRKKPMHMAEWVGRLDAFLQFNERNILTHAGQVSHQLAEEHAHAQFATYDQRRRQLEAREPTSDFDRAIEQVKRLEKKPPAQPPKRAPRKKKGTDKDARDEG